MTNPILADGLPAFSQIRPEHALPAIEHCLDNCRKTIADIEALGDDADYKNVLEAEQLADNALGNAWSTLSHLHSVNSTDEWRQAYSSCLEPLTRFSTERSHNRTLWRAYETLAARADFEQQDNAVQAAIKHELRDFRLAGVHLDKDKRDRLGEISLRLSELSNRFGNQVMDATEAFTEHFEDRSALAGLPDSELDTLAGLAAAAGKKGWLANLSFPAYRAIITWADDRQLRRRFHHAFVTRASDTGPHGGRFDNGPVMEEMLALRQEQAELLGFEHHAQAKLQTRMARSTEQIETFLHDLAGRARPLAEQQFEALKKFAKQQGAEQPLAPWDIPYWSEKLRVHQLGFSQDQLKPWFELNRVFDGVFSTATELFGVRFERDESVECWHGDVQFFRMFDHHDQPVAGLYLDLYARARKSGGAWMNTCRDRVRIAPVSQQPVAYLTCNFAPPASDSPSLLTHDDVVTLFHEFGHCLHHLLTRVDVPAVAGISGVEWDAVELPSQLLEGWAWERESLNRFARHADTGQPLPDHLLKGLLADRQFHGALGLLRQIEFALLDLALHTAGDSDPVEIMKRIGNEISVLPKPEDNRFAMSFLHLFDGGYSAGYYSYLWAELLARDGFELFREQGLFNQAAGARLADEILSVGSSRPMQASWQAFRGREPRLEPLLESWGIAA